jgi:hypothetical protein
MGTCLSPALALALPSRALALPSRALAYPSRALARPSRALARPSRALVLPSRALSEHELLPLHPGRMHSAKPGDLQLKCVDVALDLQDL